MGRKISLGPGGDLDAVAKEVEQRYATELRRPFPYKDCYELQKLQPQLTLHLVADLDAYFSFVSGYSSSATRLGTRPITELRVAIPKLQKFFFDSMPRYGKLQTYVTREETPDLYEELRAINEVRQSLVKLMYRLI